MGPFCESDVDGCNEISCYEGVDCFDVPAPGEGAMCGPCPVGFTGDGQKCLGMNHSHLKFSLPSAPNPMGQTVNCVQVYSGTIFYTHGALQLSTSILIQCDTARTYFIVAYAIAFT